MNFTKIIQRKNNTPYTVRDNRDRFFFPDEWNKFIQVSKKKQTFTFNFLLNTGSRINEARNVQVQDIDLDRKRIVLRVTKVKAKKKETKPRPRIIPISEKFTKYLRKHIRENKLTQEDYLGILSTSAGNTGMKRALQNAEIKDWEMFSIHNIRKTFEIWLMALRVDGLTITAHVGHSMSTAAGHYVSPDVFTPEERKEIRLLLGGLYER